MNLKFLTQNTNKFTQVWCQNESPSLKDKNVMHIQLEKCLNIKTFFPLGFVICHINIAHAKNYVNICFGFGYIDVSFLKTVPIFTKQLQENLWSYAPKI